MVQSWVAPHADTIRSISVVSRENTGGRLEALALKLCPLFLFKFPASLTTIFRGLSSSSSMTRTDALIALLQRSRWLARSL